MVSRFERQPEVGRNRRRRWPVRTGPRRRHGRGRRLDRRRCHQTRRVSKRYLVSGPSQPAPQINEMRDYVNFQSHTIFHPCLTKCNYDEAKEEILKSKIILERDYQLNINALAYPNGDYTNREIVICKSAGYKCAITVDAG